MNKDELRAAIAWLDACLIDIDKTHAERSLDEATSADYTAGLALRDQYAAELAGIEAREAEIARLAANPVHVERATPEAPQVQRTHEDPFEADLRFALDASPREVRTKVRDTAMRALDTVPFQADEHREAVEGLLSRSSLSLPLAQHILATGSEAYRDAFAKVFTGRGDELDDAERKALTRSKRSPLVVGEERTAMSLTSGNGGYLIPFELDPTIILTNNGTINDIRRISTVKTVATNVWHGASSAGVTASYDSEGSEVSDDSPTVAQPTVTLAMARAFVQASFEATDDIAGLAEDIVMLFGDAKDRLEANKFTLGSGSGEPKGIVTAVYAVTASRVAATTNDAFGKEDVYALQASTPARHRARGTWLAQLLTYNKIRAFDTYGGGAFWTNLGGGTPAELLGRPIAEAEDMDGTLGTGDDDILVYGDFSKFLICDRIGMSVEYVQNLFGSNGRPTGQRGWLARWRNGSDVLDVNAFRGLRV